MQSVATSYFHLGRDMLKVIYKVNIPNKDEGVCLFYVIQEWKTEAQYFFDCSWGRERITFHISMLMELAWKPVIFLLRIKIMYYN